jgi:hypothetical protein
MLLFLVCTSCASTKFFQVIETTSVNSTLVNGYHVYENNDIKVIYNFWGNGGHISFRITNKTDQPLYIDWTQSHLIYNGVSYDYWNDTEEISSFYFSNSSTFATSNSNLQFSGWGATAATVGTGNRTTAAQSTTVRMKPKRTTHLPPHSSVDLEGSRIMSAALFDCEFNWKNAKGDPSSKRNFSLESSPLRFRNYLTYAAEATIEIPQIIDNEFYISSANFISEKEYWGPTKTVSKCTVTGVPTTVYEHERLHKKGDSWYLKY